MKKTIQTKETQWYQTEQTLTIKYPISGVSLKKIDFFLTDNFLKINITERKSIKFFDFHSNIEYQNKGNSFLYINDYLEITLYKQEAKLWPNLLIDNLSKEELLKRREEATNRKREQEAEHLKNLNDLKIKYDRYSVSEQMRLEQKERDLIENLKKEEKEKTLKDLYESIDDDLHLKKPQNKNEIFEEFVDQKPGEIEEEMIEVIREIPEPREGKTLQLKFTEKIYPHLAAREQHFKDAPFPKTKGNATETKDGDQENPLWLKDKGNDFFQNKDYYSAINAYNSAYKKNNKLIECIANRSACHLALFNFRECISDCNEILEYLEKSETQNLENNDIIKLKVKLKARKAIALSWEGSDSSFEKSKEIFEDLLKEPIEKEPFYEQIKKNYEIFRNRHFSKETKILGDLEFKKGDYKKSLEYYEKSLNIDKNNEIVLGNISLCYMRMEDYPQALNFLEKCLEIIESHFSLTYLNANANQSSSEAIPHIVKLLNRKAEILRKLAKKDEALLILNKILRIDQENPESKAMLQTLEEEKALLEVKALKDSASESLKKEEFLSALSFYNEALKKVNQKNMEGVLEYLAILLNKALCHLKLEQFDDIINIGIRGLKLIKSLKNSILAFESKKLSKDQKNKLTSFELRFLIRRSNAYLKQNQIFNAKSDLEEALKLDPDNSEISQELEKIKKIST